MGVDRIQNHNTWLLAGTELNSKEAWVKYGFRTRRRLIHGDEGVYRAPSGDEIHVFEYEESLRETKTMSEEDMFYRGSITSSWISAGARMYTSRS